MCLSAGHQLGSSTQWWLAGSSLCTGVGCLLVGGRKVCSLEYWGVGLCVWRAWY